MPHRSQDIPAEPRATAALHLVTAASEPGTGPGDPAELERASAAFAQSDLAGLAAWLDATVRRGDRLPHEVVPGLVKAALRILQFALPGAPEDRVEVVVVWLPEFVELRMGPQATWGRASSTVVLLQSTHPHAGLPDRTG